jgi:hypothetical protein
VLKQRPLTNSIDFQIPFIFSEYDYTSIVFGNDLIDKETCLSYILPNHRVNMELYSEVIDSQKYSLEVLPSHNYVIDKILETPDDIM